MKQSIILKTLLILGSVITVIFLSAGYLFLQNDQQLISQIRQYNLNSAMDALDKREEIVLELNKQQIQSSIERISKNASLFLFNFDVDGLETTLMLDLKQPSVQAIEVWDSTVNELFLLVLKQGDTILTQKELPKSFEKFTKFKKDILHMQRGKTEKLGVVTFYYDDSLIKKEIQQLKTETKKKIENFDKTIDQQQLESNIVKLTIALGALFTILVIISLLLLKFVNNPLKTLQNGLNEFFLFLQNKQDNVQKITINTNDEFGDMANSLNDNISVSAKLHEEIHELNTNLEKRIAEKTEKITTLLDNADQGFLSFGEDLIINDEYSKECLHIFKKEIANTHIAELLYTDETKKKFFTQTLKSLLKETNEQKIKTIISLLQSEFIINKKAINIKYKIIDDNQFMLILTDITAQKILQKKINKEKNILKMIVSVVTDTHEFFELIEEFEIFSKQKRSLVDFTKTPLHNATELYRTIHTFKGLFAQKEMSELVSKLHDLESELSQILTDPNQTNESLNSLIGTSPFEEWLNHEISIIKNILGEELFESKGKVTVKEESLSLIEKKIILLASKHNELSTYEPVVNDLKSLKYKTVYTLLSSYPKLLDQLSQRLDKSIYPLEIIVDKSLKVEDRFKPFFKSLIHVFRNAIDHGIESMDERAEIEKDEIGTITCTAKITNDNLHITIADDGRGIDIEKIKQKAANLDIDTSELNNNQIYSLIFHDRLSTKNDISDVSGRGVGMAAVKVECDKLNGIIQINSERNIGTTIEFIIPLLKG